MTHFEHLGWFEEYYVRQPDGSYKWKGKKPCGDPGQRKTGSEGIEDCVLTEPTELSTGLKTVLIRASTSRPVEARTIIYPLCGRVLPAPTSASAKGKTP